MKILKKVFAVVLCVVLTLTAAPLSGLVGLELPSLFDFEAEAATISSYSQGDIIEFGWYPQSKVTDSDIIAKLNSAGGEWISYNYYSGTGTWNDGKMTAGDYMRYKDVIYGSDKYRGVVFDTYRPYHTGDKTTSSDSYSYQGDNGYTPGTVYWFKYEPIEWRVLDPDKGMVMSETIIDAQPYNNYILKNGTDEYGETACWGDSAKTYYANNYAESSIRQWLNKDFYNTAFSTAQQNIIEYTQLDNSAYSDSYSAYDSQTTNDKIYLMSWDDASNTDYGFSSSYSSEDTARRAQGSDYAKCQGMSVSTISGYEGNSYWRLRTPGDDSIFACDVNDDGIVYNYSLVSSNYGIRPALNFNLSSGIFQSDVIDTCEHISGDWQTKTEPTCTGEGVSVKKCTVCQAELETQPIDATGHTPGEWETKTEPTCTGEGISVKKCTVCKAELETQPIDVTGHTPGEWETKTEPTCTEEGISIKKCTVCKAEVETAPIDALGHSAGEWKITTYPTTTEEGVKTLYCSVCGDGYDTLAMPVLDAICDYLTWEITDEGYTEITGYKDGITGDIILPSTIYGYPVIIGDGAFAGCGITGVTIPEGLSTIGECAFAYCTSLVTVNLPANLENLDCSAFIGSTNIESIVINENNPFYCTDENGIIYNKGKTRLIYAPAKSVGEAYVMPETVITADEFAFADCTDFSLTLSDNFHIDSDNAFFFMVSVNEFVTNESNIYYKAVDGVLYSEDGLTLIKYPVDSKRELFVLPDNVSSVADMNAFVVYEAEQAAIYCFDLPCDNNTYDFYKEPEYLTVHVNTFDSLDSDSLSHIMFGTSHICIGDITAENMKSLNAAADNAVANIESQWLEEKDKYTPGTNAYYFNKAMILGCVDIIASFIDCNNDHSFLHKYAEEIDYKAATCTEDGYGDYSCECGYSFHKDYEATGHNYEEEITVKVGCTTAGKKTYTCHCGDSYTELVPATGHSLKKSHIDPTCITDGKDCYVCANCLTEFSVKILPATGHTEGDWEVKSEPSCTKAGVKVKKCTDCGEELETEYFGEPTGHSYKEEIVSAPTCTAEGKTKYTCHCGDSYTVTIPVLDHDKVRYYTAPTCLEPGMEYYLCNSCGNMIGDMEIIPETGHIYGWAVVVAPTATESGSKKQVCTGCGEETGVVETIPATGFEPTNGMIVDYANNIVYGLDAGVDSLDSYTNVVADGYEWTYIPGQFGGFGTGTKATLKNGNEIVAEYTLLIYGDLNGDGWYDGEDAFLTNLIVAGMLTQENIPDYLWKAADCNHDGEINETDVDLLMGAGLKKNDIDQNASQSELSTQAAYIEYMSIIDQSAGLDIEPDTDETQQGTITPDTIGTVDSNEPATENDIDIEVIFTNIFEFFKKIFSFVFSFIIK